MNDLIDIYDIEKTCLYRGEIYHVRDNGAIFRCRRPNKNKRPLDEKWTFGNPNDQTGYMNVASETVHRIVATAFHGDQPNGKSIVDHIDTNRRNNRPENLRWITRLENLLLNPITRNRILFSYGSLDNFFENPSEPIYESQDKNFDWMRTVSKEESENTRRNLLKWVEEGTVPNGGELSEWVYSQSEEFIGTKTTENEYIQSLTPNAIQINWKTPNEFPNCPNIINIETLINYEKNLQKGKAFSINKFGTSKIEEFQLSSKSNELLVLTIGDNSIKPFALAKVYIDEKSIVHESVGSFFTKNGALKEFKTILGEDWNGEETIDDYTR